MSLSAVINTKNAAATLEKTLNSVKFADEIIVVDMHSVDETRKIAKKFTNKIFLHEDMAFADPARNFALNKATKDWILMIDADEVVPLRLRKYIKQAISEQTSVDIFLIPRKNLIFQHEMSHTGWWPDYHPRLFRNGVISWPNKIHQHPTLTGQVKKLPLKKDLALIHLNYPDVSSFIDRLNRYTLIQAQEAQAGFQEDIDSSHLIRTFFDEFFKRFFVLSGYQDQVVGTGLSFLQAVYELTAKLKMWELQGHPPSDQNSAEIIQSLSTARTHLNYWLADWQVKHSSGLNQLFWRVRRKLRI